MSTILVGNFLSSFGCTSAGVSRRLILKLFVSFFNGLLSFFIHDFSFFSGIVFFGVLFLLPDKGDFFLESIFFSSMFTVEKIKYSL